MHQDRSSHASPFPSTLNYDAMPSLNLPILPYYSVFAADTLLYAVILTFDPVTLTLDLEHLRRIVCDVINLFTEGAHNRIIHGGVIAISVFDLMTLNMF